VIAEHAIWVMPEILEEEDGKTGRIFWEAMR
jgi:hypothetical protein